MESTTDDARDDGTTKVRSAESPRLSGPDKQMRGGVECLSNHEDSGKGTDHGKIWQRAGNRRRGKRVGRRGVHRRNERRGLGLTMLNGCQPPQNRLATVVSEFGAWEARLPAAASESGGGDPIGKGDAERHDVERPIPSEETGDGGELWRSVSSLASSGGEGASSEDTGRRPG
jgi:hypothetical protein